MVREALQEALGIGFEGRRGEHFFRSTLVQTLFYGVFSAWVLWSKRTPPDSSERFDWRLAAYTLNVPLIRALFEQLTLRSTIEALGLREVMDRTGELLNRVERGPFFEDFEEEGAVQYFYEPFLEAFDPELRQQLGVWYTPREVVRYMVERVDQTLRDEFEIRGWPCGRRGVRSRSVLRDRCLPGRGPLAHRPNAQGIRRGRPGSPGSKSAPPLRGFSASRYCRPRSWWPTCSSDSFCKTWARRSRKRRGRGRASILLTPLRAGSHRRMPSGSSRWRSSRRSGRPQMGSSARHVSWWC